MEQDVRAEKSLEAWGFARKVLDDLTAQITADARDERELLEGLRLLNRVSALCTELTVDTDPDNPPDEARLAQIEKKLREALAG